MNVYLTFDIEVWCDGWRNLDQVFPVNFERYVYGRSKHGDYALPKTLDILNRHGLKGIFFVEPLFAARFGVPHLETIVRLIRAAGQEVQLHIHTEWTDEALQPIIENCAKKRQHLRYYTLAEQTSLIGYGKRMLEAAGSGPISAFRAGSYAANRDTFVALAANDIFLDFSLNQCCDISAPELRPRYDFSAPFQVEGVSTYPLTVFKDGFCKDRPAQVGACSFAEMRDALLSAQRAGVNDFVMISHNFEMLKPDTALPDWVVVRRFEKLSGYLAQNTDKFTVRGATEVYGARLPTLPLSAQPRANMSSTFVRYMEQLRRRAAEKCLISI